MPVGARMRFAQRNFAVGPQSYIRKGETPMKNDRKKLDILYVTIALVGITLFNPSTTDAHCDGMDGPVVKAAQAALLANDVNLALIWVRPGDEAEIRRLFERTIRVRTLSPEAGELADLYFFETLVRLHRAGEGAPYAGLKPAGRDLGPALPAADQALISGDVAPLMDLLMERLRTGLSDTYRQTSAVKNFKPEDVDGGRAYVERYVSFVHYVEGVYEAMTRTAKGHHLEGSEGVHDEH